MKKRSYYAASKRSTTKHIIHARVHSAGVTAACGRKAEKGWAWWKEASFRRMPTCKGCLAAA